ncbi:hypothetical protein TNCV_1192771 [Trichonephila clavipes]|nr:hypothetical protein TNCV_1192771 [Trichonephila clavipes]
MGRIVVRASDSRPEGLGSMPNAAKYPPSTHGFPAEIVEVEKGGVAIYRPFGDFRRAKSYCHLYGAQGQTTGVLLAPCHDEFRGPQSDYIRQVALETTTTTQFPTPDLRKMNEVLKYELFYSIQIIFDGVEFVHALDVSDSPFLYDIKANTPTHIQYVS